MRIEHMRYIVEVSKWKSINKAASHLYLNQQQLSRVIAAVEHDLDTAIFHRNTKGIFLTPEGERIIAQFEKILTLYDDLHHPQEKPDTIQGQLKVFSEINLWTSYARFYKDFTKTYPNVQCFIKNMASEDILLSLQQQDGIGIISRIYGENIQGFAIPDPLEFHPISKSRLTVYGSSNNPYRKKYQSITLATLRKLPLINFKPYDNHASLMDIVFQNTGPRNIQYEVSDIKVFHALIAENDCLFLAVKKPQYLGENNLIEIPLRNKIFLEHGVVKRKQTAKLYETFLTYYQNYYQGLYADRL